MVVLVCICVEIVDGCSRLFVNIVKFVIVEVVLNLVVVGFLFSWVVIMFRGLYIVLVR